MKKDKAWFKEQVERLSYTPKGLDENSSIISKNWVLTFINQLDEPQKPVVPQFVADYIEQSKKDNDSINQVFAFIDDKEDKDLWHWLFPSVYEEKRANQEVFMRAWLDGYEAEKEKRYIIKFAPSVYGTPVYGSIGMQNGKKIMQSVYSTQKAGVIPNQYTQKEIEKVGIEYMAFAEEVTE